MDMASVWTLLRRSFTTRQFGLNGEQAR